MKDSNSFKKWMRKLFAFSLFPVLFFAWQLSLPYDQYHFRAWEAALSGGPPYTSPLLPHLHIERNEVGDLVPFTDQAILKHTIWETDEYGFRNSSPLCVNPETIIMGDSMALGASLDQKDIVSEQLAIKKHICVRNLAGGRPNRPMAWMRTLGYRPKNLIIVLAERNVEAVYEYINENDTETVSMPPSIFKPLMNLYKLSFWNYSRSHGIFAALKRSFMSRDEIDREIAPHSLDTPKKMQFFGSIQGSENMSEAAIKAWVFKLDAFAEVLRPQGTLLTVVLVPNKESIYFSEAHRSEPTFKNRLLAQLKQEKYLFRFVDLFTPFSKVREQGLTPYSLDDTHWNQLGVSLLVNEIEK